MNNTKAKVIAQRLYTDATYDKDGVPAARVTPSRAAAVKARRNFGKRNTK